MSNDRVLDRNNEIEVWELDLKTYEWVLKVDFPGNLSDRVNAFFTHNNKIYVLREKFRGSFSTQPMELWSFDPEALN